MLDENWIIYFYIWGVIKIDALLSRLLFLINGQKFLHILLAHTKTTDAAEQHPKEESQERIPFKDAQIHTKIKNFILSI